MREFSAFLNKELLERFRKGRLWILGGVFFAMGVISPLMAWVTPILYDMLSEEFAQIGMTVGEIHVSAIDSWLQFVGNVPMAMLVTVILFSGAYTGEYSKGTLIPLVTKGLPRRVFVLAKLLAECIVWTGGLLLCFMVTYIGTALLWDNSTVKHLLFACFGWWLYGVFFLCAAAAFSAFMKSMVQVLLCLGSLYIVIRILGFFPMCLKYLPTKLSSSATLYTGAEGPADFIPAILIVAVLSAVFVIIAVKVTDKRQL